MIGTDAADAAPTPPAGGLLSAHDLTKVHVGQRSLAHRRRNTRALDNVSFSVGEGETFGIVGESGCGKSTLARCLLRLTKVTDGTIFFEGRDITAVDGRELRGLRRRMQILFQDPYASLDRRLRIEAAVREPLDIHRIGDKSARRDAAASMLEMVGITARQMKRRPHELSGGQRQRVALARALVLNPSLVILDEPVSALDVSVQAQVLNLLAQLQAELRLTYIFIVHDLAIAEYFCDRVMVLYAGRVAELASAATLFARPLHPYTVALLSAVPQIGGAARERIVLPGEVVAGETETGCVFRPRCPVGRDREICHSIPPPLTESEVGHAAACHFPGELVRRDA